MARGRAERGGLPDFARLHDGAPHARLLGNGRYWTLLTGAGTGFSAWRGLQLTAFEADRTQDPHAIAVYLRDAATGAGFDLSPRRSGGSASHAPGAVSLEGEGDGLAARLDVCVHPERDLELRVLRIADEGGRDRHIQVTIAAEIALNRPLAHESHPAFSKLFVETAEERGVLLARRRPRSRGEAAPCLAACLAGPGALAFETDRARFLGRGRSLSRPRALEPGAVLSGTTGSVLDPVFALRREVRLAANQSLELGFVLAAADDREGARSLAADAARPESWDAILATAATAERARLAHLGIDAARAVLLHEIFGAMLYAHPALRADPEVLRRARGPLRQLGRAGVGRDLPLVVVADGDEALAREAAELEAYLRSLGAEIAVRRLDEFAAADRDLVAAWAALVVREPLAAIAAKLSDGTAAPSARFRAAAEPATSTRAFAGSFERGGVEYAMRLEGERPPMPWVNVVANERAGFLASESGAACTWARNSRENKLTPWSNDPIADPHGEALYLRDEEEGVFWSPQPGPAPAPEPYQARHGHGYTVWSHESHGLAQVVTAFVPREDPLAIARLEVEDLSGRARELSAFAYRRLLLGALVSESARLVTTQWDAEAGILFARGIGDERQDEVTFCAAAAEGALALHASADRASFIGRGGSPEQPAALCSADTLDGRSGAGLDACAALQVRLRVPPRGRASLAFLLGEAASEAEARALVARYRKPGAVDEALREARAAWADLCLGLVVETPSPALDALASGWLAYQTLSCRIWARSAFYQSGGAFGFRDQLQDAAALVWLRPDLTRAQILLHAAHQFEEGDVLHWWHPPSQRGPRTRFSDDLLWLPYLAAGYASHTGDARVFDERVPFVRAQPLQPGEDEVMIEATASSQSDTIFGHCLRAIDRSLAVGAHGLPLMGTGDWNDGMNRVGREGRGESVWLGFFLHAILGEFVPLCQARAESERAERYAAHRDHLSRALEAAWDGAWFRRAYYDDGTPLGTADSEECRIDVLPQAWAVLTGAVSRERAARALDSAEEHLVSRADGIVRLLTPPFDRTSHDPGYIRGYVPGIRENGGQYTHAALWLVRALAVERRRDRAAPLLEMLSPVWHSRSGEAVARYQVEPYVVAADVYGAPPHVGRGGWTWYTGSAGWFLRVLVESILGLSLVGGERLRIRPCIPDEWPGFRVAWRVPGTDTRYEIEVSNSRGCSEAVVSATLDGCSIPIEDEAAVVPLARDGREHTVVVQMGPAL